MSRPETLEGQIWAVMETVAEAAVAELRRLLEESSAAAARQHSAAATAAEVKREEEGSEVVLPEDRRHFNEHLTNQFASLMKTWTRGAVEKISLMLKMSTCEAEDVPAAEQTAGLDGEMEQTRTNPEREQITEPTKKSAARRSRQRRKKIQRGFQPAAGKTDDHIYCREEQQTEKPTAAADSESVTEPADAASYEEKNSEPEAVLTEPTPDSASNIDEDTVQEDTNLASTPSKIKKKATAGLFKCPSCEKTFALKCLMDRHFLTHSRPHLCSECGKRFAVLRTLIAHSRRHTGEKLYKCSLCGTEFAYKSTFHRHMRQHNTRKPNTHTCPLCENQFSGLLALQRHRCCALKKTFVCSLCPETFECRQSLAEHENLHSGDRDFVCEVCGESFFSSSSLSTHRFTHTQKENCCDELGLGCSDMSVLRNHLSKHTGEKLFTCEVCGKGCSHKSALMHHMLTHTGERPYVCETCGKRCSHASALQNHMRIHTGKKPGQQPVCDVCGKKFSCTVNLKYHMSTHTGERPYACDQCEKKFTNPSNLKLHMVIHSGEKMYGCNICGRRFTQSSSLKLHRRVHTGEKPYHCEVCGKEFVHRSDFRNHQKNHPAEKEGDGQTEKTEVKV
ncbi:oocyte zinc finger protein XlCOF6-like [Amphiprion ocellaris]|uniref:oocyte zinc finger protein XlCOF6-like n=1 Tax=Amphiprion ocellaris TaxID=80972 RepID=UPI00241136E5|nr:oocyte zinc finger protein XlCOF6-like [Amphiprion ocellaris]